MALYAHGPGSLMDGRGKTESNHGDDQGREFAHRLGLTYLVSRMPEDGDSGMMGCAQG